MPSGVEYVSFLLGDLYEAVKKCGIFVDQFMENIYCRYLMPAIRYVDITNNAHRSSDGREKSGTGTTTAVTSGFPIRHGTS